MSVETVLTTFTMAAQCIKTVSQQAGCSRSYSRLRKRLQRRLVQVRHRDAGCQLQAGKTYVLSVQNSAGHAARCCSLQMKCDRIGSRVSE